MTTWSPGVGGPDVLSSGDGEKLRRSTGQAVARLLLCLGAGIAVAAHVSADRVAAHESAEPSRPDSGAGCARSPGYVPPRGRCPRGRPARTSDLRGTWLRVGVQGVWRGAEGREFMRFEPGGRFTWGLTGHLTSPVRALRGHYVDAAGTVTVTAHRTSLCSAGDTYTWRATLSGRNRLHLTYAPGAVRTCGSRATDVWNARRSPRRAGTCCVPRSSGQRREGSTTRLEGLRPR